MDRHFKFHAIPSIAPCAQSCVLEVNTNISCWSYGCVCSENTLLGTNYQASLAYVQSCVSDSCENSTDVVEAADAFKSICALHYGTVVLSTTTITPTGAATGTAATISVVTVTTAASSPTTTAPFQASDAIIIDTPDEAYQALTPCVRFVFNGCKSPKDNPPGQPPNCNTSFPGNYTGVWTGLGADLQCSTVECVCKEPQFFYSLQHAFDEASYLCDFTIPTQETPSPQFQALGEMLAAFCSENGFVLETWMLDLVGYQQLSGLDNGSKVGIGTGVPSFVVAVGSLWLAWVTIKEKRAAQVPGNRNRNRSWISALC